MSGKRFYKGNPHCPKCKGDATVVLEEPWWECQTRVLKEVIPEHVTGGRREPIYGLCGHRFDVDALRAAKEEKRAEKERREREWDRKDAKAREIATRLTGLDNPHAILDQLGQDGEVQEQMPIEPLKAAWIRAVARARAPGDLEVVTMENGGRGWTLNKIWQTGERVAAFRASWKEIEGLPSFYTPMRHLTVELHRDLRELQEEGLGLDLVLDVRGRIWKIHPWRAATASEARNEVCVPVGTDIKVRRRRPGHGTAYIEFENAICIEPYEDRFAVSGLAIIVGLQTLARGQSRSRTVS